MRSARFCVLSLVLAAVTACGGGAAANDAAAAGPAVGQANVQDNESVKDVVKIAVGSKDHSTLVAALQAADLVNSLANAGPFTVFAPVNAAFDKLPKGTVDNLLKPENKAALAALLKRHFVVGSLDQYDLKRQRELATAGGDKLPVKLVAGSIRIADARVFGRQSIAVNGTVQPLDTVLTH